MSDDALPDFDSVPDTRDLVQPKAHEVPLWTLANTIAIRAMRREQKETRAALKAWGFRIVTAIIGGAVTMAGAVVGVAISHGEDRERSRHTQVEVSELGERVTYLERKNDGRARRGRESEE